MAHLIQSNNCLTAWRDVCRHILQNGDGFNMLVQIDNPLAYTQAQLNEVTNSGVISAVEVNDVVNTIFPTKLHGRSITLSNSQFYDKHEQIYLRGKKMHKKNRSRWGNYFLRFTKFGINRKNQLQPIIDGINNRSNNQKACYIMHVSSIDLDNNTRVIGNPCLQYVQFGVYNNALHLSALYRNHDFLTKALGNYVGLSKLLEFVCNETNSTMGSVTVQSLHYELKNKTAVRACLNNLTW
jgi:thymidylate synthase